MKEHVLICVMGKTASGKDTLVHQLCEPGIMTQVISYATRPRRDREGNTHHFVTDQEYEQMKSDDNIAAYTQIGTYRYWSTVDQLYENDFYIIDPNGVKTLKALNLPNLRIVTVYINTPDNVREDRALQLRHDNRSTFLARDIDERQQFRSMLSGAEFDYAILNIDFAKAYSVLKWICSVEGVWKNREVKE